MHACMHDDRPAVSYVVGCPSSRLCCLLPCLRLLHSLARSQRPPCHICTRHWIDFAERARRRPTVTRRRRPAACSTAVQYCSFTSETRPAWLQTKGVRASSCAFGPFGTRSSSKTPDRSMWWWWMEYVYGSPGARALLVLRHTPGLDTAGACCRHCMRCKGSIVFDRRRRTQKLARSEPDPARHDDDDDTADRYGYWTHAWSVLSQLATW